MDTRELRGLFEAYQQVHVSVDEAVKGQDTEERREASRERKRGDKRLSPSAGKANADKMERDIKFYDKVTKKTRPSVVGMTHEEVEKIDEEPTLGRIKSAMASQRSAQNAAGMRGSELTHGAKPAVKSPAGSAAIKPQPRSREFSHGGSGTPLKATLKGGLTMSYEPQGNQLDEIKTSQTTKNDRVPNFEKQKVKQVPGLVVPKPHSPVEEEFDIFDVVLEFLQTEGYAETLEEAEWMMANVINEEAIDIILGESALGTMAVLGGMAAGRAIHGKLQARKAKKELEGKRRTSDYLGMKSRTKNVVARDRRASGDTRNEEFELWVNSLVEEGYDLSEYTWDEMYDIYEAEGSYGETPKAYSAALKTKMTAKRKPFLKAMQRRTNPANRKDAYASPRKGMTASDREEARAGAAHGSPRGHDYPSEGPGGITKNPKKLRKQKAMGEHG